MNHDTPIETLSFIELWNPHIIVLIIFVAILYIAVTGPLLNRFTEGES